MARPNIRPLRDKVLVEPLEAEEKSKGGIILPDTAKEKPQEGKVIAVGTGKIGDDGKTIPMAVKKGDKVLYGKYGGTDVKIGDTDYKILSEEDIMAVVEE